MTSVQGDRLQALRCVPAGRACALERNAVRELDTPGAGQKVQEGRGLKSWGAGLATRAGWRRRVCVPLHLRAKVLAMGGRRPGGGRTEPC